MGADVTDPVDSARKWQRRERGAPFLEVFRDEHVASEHILDVVVGVMFELAGQLVQIGANDVGRSARIRKVLVQICNTRIRTSIACC
jgi:hypothetical protein